MADTLVEDTVAWPLLADLSQCLCDQLAAASDRKLCFCGVVTGEQVDGSLAGYDGCTGGMAWVRVTNIFPSTTFPNPDLLTGCSTLLAVEVEVGTLRPMVIPRGRKLPSVGDLAVATQQAMSDMAAMHRAIACCASSSSVDFVYQLGNYLPIGPEGGLVGGTWTFTFQQAF